MDSNAYITAKWEHKYGSIPEGYQFRGNLMIKNNEVHLIMKGGSETVAPFDHWLEQLAIGAERLFGPPMKMRDWSDEKLKEARAVGFYCKD